jgi:hypothetical protein
MRLCVRPTCDSFGPIWTATAFYPMARVVFGAEVLNGQIARVDEVLANNGYSAGRVSMRQRHQAIALVLLLNHSPWLDDLSWAALERAASTGTALAARQARQELRSPAGRAQAEAHDEQQWLSAALQVVMKLDGADC